MHEGARVQRVAMQVLVTYLACCRPLPMGCHTTYIILHVILLEGR